MYKLNSIKLCLNLSKAVYCQCLLGQDPIYTAKAALAFSTIAAKATLS